MGLGTDMLCDKDEVRATRDVLQTADQGSRLLGAMGLGKFIQFSDTL